MSCCRHCAEPPSECCVYRRVQGSTGCSFVSDHVFFSYRLHNFNFEINAINTHFLNHLMSITTLSCSVHWCRKCLAESSWVYIWPSASYLRSVERVPSPFLAVWLGHIGRLASRLPFELYGPSRDIWEDDCCNVSKIMTFVSSTDLSNPT